MDEEEEFNPPVKTSPDEFETSILDASNDFQKTLKQKFSPEDYKRIRTIGALIMRGLTLEECCILSRVDLVTLKELMTEHADVRAFIIFKQTAFKAGLLNTLVQSGIVDKDVKSAGYILEKKFRKEFDPKKGDETERDPDVIEKAIKHVMENGDSLPIVKALPVGIS